MYFVSDNINLNLKNRMHACMQAKAFLGTNISEVDTLIGIILSFRICCTEDDCLCAKSCYKASLLEKAKLDTEKHRNKIRHIHEIIQSGLFTLATLILCCSIASCMVALSCSLMLPETKKALQLQASLSKEEAIEQTRCNNRRYQLKGKFPKMFVKLTDHFLQIRGKKFPRPQEYFMFIEDKKFQADITLQNNGKYSHNRCFSPTGIWRLPIKFINTAKSTICKNKGPSFQHPLSCKQINKTKQKEIKRVTQQKGQTKDWSAYLHPSLQLQSIQHLCFLVPL